MAGVKKLGEIGSCVGVCNSGAKIECRGGATGAILRGDTAAIALGGTLATVVS